MDNKKFTPFSKKNVIYARLEAYIFSLILIVMVWMDKDDIHSCIRMTFNGNETIEELDYVCSKLKECVERLRNLSK